ncbi:hypothetical protein GJ744_011284 [Endocarpon pusillum]|uniref:Uncharacterized protein n=1 Tax=Endocarpon pusillum TaxID=364733 RepID=A0A8H7APT2_9EURO|nr:hypothetical protein GJ744_011284 [Endocarpon pusillum]
MNVITLLVLILGVPILFLLVFLALSSCLGDRLRMRGFSPNTRDGNYSKTYFRTMTNSGPAMSEHIEMETMLNERDFEHER